METGKVRFFNADRRFGFIQTEDGKEIFFHFNDGEFIFAGKAAPEFTGEATSIIQGKERRLRDPKRDDLVVFERYWNPRGDIARPWGFKSQFDRATEVIAKRPAPTRYRIFSSSGSWGQAGKPGDPKDAKVIWEGNDMDKVMRRFPPPKGRQSPGSDPLIPYFSHDDGFEVRHWWERQLPDGSWQQCEDPRELSGVNRQFERITNRW